MNPKNKLKNNKTHKLKNNMFVGHVHPSKIRVPVVFCIQIESRSY